MQTPSLKPFHIHIEPQRGFPSLRLQEIWEYRELIFFLAWRDVIIRYKQTILGAAWAILQPLFSMVIFSLFLGRLAGVPSDGIPYPLFNFAALLPWTFFANGVTQAANSLVGSANLLKKVYFPRLIIPLSSVLGGVVDFGLLFLVLILMMAAYDVNVTINMLWLPLLLLLTFITALGVSLWLTAMNVQFRDIRYAVPFLIQAWLFATPVTYPSSLLEQPWRILYALNPMVGVIEGFRWAMLGTDTAPGPIILVSSLIAVLLLISGAYYFRHLENTFADVV